MGGESCDYGADENELASRAGAKTAWDGGVKARDGGEKAGNVDAKIRQARGVWLKMIADVSPYPTPLLARIDGLLGAPAESLQPDSASHDSRIA